MLQWGSPQCVSMESHENFDRVEHLWILGLALCAIVGSFALHQSDAGGLEFPVPGMAGTVSLPDTCMSRRFFGVSCPGCGLSRSFVAMGRAEVGTALRLHPLGPCLYLLCWLQIPYRLGEYFGVGRYWRVWARADRWLHVISWAVMIALLVAWAARMLLS
jgi:hypothetical protein